LISLARDWLPAVQVLRPADGLPVLGRSRNSACVIYAFGHQHIGLTLGGLSGMVVADQLAGRESVIDPQPFAAARFR